MVASGANFKAFGTGKADGAIGRGSDAIGSNVAVVDSNAKVPLFVPVNYRDGQDPNQEEHAAAVIQGLANLDPKAVPSVAKKLQSQIAMFSGNSPVAYWKGSVQLEDETISSRNRITRAGGFTAAHQLPGANAPIGAAELFANYPTKLVPSGRNTKSTGKEFSFADFGSAPVSLKRARMPGDKEGSYVVASADFYKPATVSLMAPRVSLALGELSAVQGQGQSA